MVWPSLLYLRSNLAISAADLLLLLAISFPNSICSRRSSTLALRIGAKLSPSFLTAEVALPNSAEALITIDNSAAISYTHQK